MDDTDDVNSGDDDDDDDDVLYDDDNSSDDCRTGCWYLPTLTSSFHLDQYHLCDGSLSMV